MGFSFLRRLRRDERGVSAIEFALIAPILIALYTGMVQLSLALTADRKVTAATSAIGDLVAQDDILTDGELANILEAGRAILQPYSAEGFNVRITSVRMDSDGDVFVDWSEGAGLAAHPENRPIDIPDGLLAPNNSVIFVEAQYRYTTPFKSLEIDIFDLSDSVYLRPRRALFVRRD